MKRLTTELGKQGALRNNPKLVAAYNSTWLPNSTTRSGGSLKKEVAFQALRDMKMNSFLRHWAMGAEPLEKRVSRPRKNEVV